jgi:citrate lyase subunit beta/citryl-CoA lyase
MSRIKKRAHAGRMDDTVRSDCYVEIEVRENGGIALELESKVGSLYGDAIRTQLTGICSSLGVRDAAFHIIDRGALPYVLAARIETAIKRALPSVTGEYHTSLVAQTRVAEQGDRLRRTRLYLPGNEPKFFPNAGLHRPDVAILDLEDSVSPEEKDAARILVRNALRSIDFYGAERGVRINQGKPGLVDLRMIVPHSPELLLVP